MKETFLDYAEYNREERDICAHLFRLLLLDQSEWGPLKEFLQVNSVSNPRIYCEVALIRDAYMERKMRKLKDAATFMSELVDYVADILGKTDFTPYYQLTPVSMCDPKQTHPKQISFKLNNESQEYSESDLAVYGAIQSMFNAKPDLAVCTGEYIYVYEAKYTEKFDRKQIRMTGQIAQVWANLLYRDLGFDSRPKVSLRALGLRDKMPEPMWEEIEQFVTWERVKQIAQESWGTKDFSVRVLSKIK